tara:strand:- start:2866 stop:3747 length:882 start_codon:yes stop_codon:yes gene_type:complete
MKGIILAGGSGTRLYPSTKAISKQLLPIYDKPMIYYPLSILMLSKITNILIISTPRDISSYKELLGNGSKYGLDIKFKVQDKPDGLAQAFILGEDFIENDNVCLILGDNIFYGSQLPKILKRSTEEVKNKKIAKVFGYYVNDPERYGVVEFDKDGSAIAIEEKPKKAKTNYAIAGLYFYPNEVIEIAKNQKPSLRGELEITDTNKEFLKMNKLKVEKMGRGFAWLDTGTHDALIEASLFVQTIEKRQGMKISCIEEIAYRLKLITKNQLISLGEEMKNNHYGKYLLNLTKNNF